MIIGIGGVSRAGKTILAEKLQKHFEKSKKTVQVFCQDQYVKPKITLSKVQGYPDWERPSTIKWDALIAAMDRSTAEIKIVEGLFAFYAASLRTLYDKRIFIDIDKATFESRRSTDKRWDEEPEWYANHVWKSYIKYGQKKGDEGEYLEIPGKGNFDVKKIVAALGL